MHPPCYLSKAQTWAVVLFLKTFNGSLLPQNKIKIPWNDIQDHYPSLILPFFYGTYWCLGAYILTWFRILSLSLTCCMTLGEIPSLSLSQFPLLK